MPSQLVEIPNDGRSNKLTRSPCLPGAAPGATIPVNTKVRALPSFKSMQTHRLRTFSRNQVFPLANLLTATAASVVDMMT